MLVIVVVLLPAISHFLNEERDFPLPLKNKFVDVYKSHQSLRSHLSDESNLVWQSTWPQSALSMGRLIEEIAYGKQYDSSIKFGARFKKEPEEIFAMAAVSEAIGLIDGLLADEQDAAKAAAKEAAGAAIESEEEEPASTVSQPLTAAEGVMEMEFVKQFAESVDSVASKVWTEVAGHKAEAFRLVKQLDMIVEPTSSTGIQNHILNSSKNVAASDGYTVVFYDTSCSGEAITNPSTRKPPLRNHYNKHMDAIVGGFCIDGKFPTNLVIFLFNAGKDGCLGPINCVRVMVVCGVELGKPLLHHRLGEAIDGAVHHHQW